MTANDRAPGWEPRASGGTNILMDDETISLSLSSGSDRRPQEALRLRVRVGANGHVRTWIYVNADAADRAVKRAKARGQIARVDLVEIVPVTGDRP